MGEVVNWKKILKNMTDEERWDFLTTQGPDYILAMTDIQGATPGHDANSLLIHTSHGMIEVDKVQGLKILSEWKAFIFVALDNMN